MALKTLKSSLGKLEPRLKRQTDDEGHSRVFEPLRHLYNTARWRRLRMEVFVRDNFTCQCGCGVIEGDTSKLVGDHRKPHRGDLDLFWDPLNVQTLRKSPCHDQLKQRQERRDRAMGR